MAPAPGPGGQRRHPRAAARRCGRGNGPHRAAARRAHLRELPRRAALRAGQAGSRPSGRGRGAGERRRVLRLARGRVHPHVPRGRGAARHPRRLDRACAGASGRGRDAAAARRRRGRRQGVRTAVRAGQPGRAPGRRGALPHRPRGPFGRGRRRRAHAGRGARRRGGPGRDGAVRDDRTALRRGRSAPGHGDGRNRRRARRAVPRGHVDRGGERRPRRRTPPGAGSRRGPP